MIIVSALDNSGQLYAASLVRELKTLRPELEFVGIGGKELAAAGVELVHDISDTSAMLAGVVGALKWAVPAFFRLRRMMRRGLVEMVILVDSPTFNLPLARAAKKRGIKTFYYIAPQVWAWGEFRVRKIRKRVDRLAVVLPFEEAYFRQHGIRADFVGHPFLPVVKSAAVHPQLVQQFAGIKQPKVLLMPGSRRHVVEELLPVQLRVVREVERQVGAVVVSVAAWPGVLGTVIRLIEEARFKVHNAQADDVLSRPGLVNVFTDERRTLIQQANLVLAASGTGTLEVAWHGRPMIVMYNASKLGYHLAGRWLIKTRYLSLINILAEKELVPEFMPYIRDEKPIIERAVRLLKDKDAALRLGWDVQKVVGGLDRDDPSRQAARLALDLLTSDA